MALFKFARWNVAQQNAQTAPEAGSPENGGISAPGGDALGSALKSAVSTANSPLRNALNPLGASMSRPAPQVAVTPKETGKIPVPAAAPELSGQPDSVKSAIADVSGGMDADQIVSKYPDLASKKDSFASLKADLDAGMPASEIPKLYPEFYEGPSLAEKAGEQIAGAAEKTAEAFKGGIARISEAGEKLGTGEYSYPQAAIRGAAGALQAFTSPVAGVSGQVSEGATEAMKQNPEDWRNVAAEKIAPAVQSITQWFDEQPEEQKQRLRDAGVSIEVLSNLVGGRAPWALAETAPVKAAVAGAESGIAKAVEAAQTAKGAVSSGIAKIAKPAAKVAEGEPKVGITAMGDIATPVELETPWIAGKALEKISNAPVIGKAVQKITGAPEWDVGSLANHAIGTKFGKMTPGEKVRAVWGEGRAKDLETLHGMVASGEIEGDLNSVLGGAEAVQSGLRKVGSDIGNELKKAGLDSKVDVAPAVSKLDKILSDKRSAVTNPDIVKAAEKYKDVLERFDTLADVQATKQDIFQDLLNLKKENLGRQSYKDFTDAAQELIAAIDKKVEDVKGFQDMKAKYASLKRLEKDISDSAMVTTRKSPVSFAEQVAMMSSGYDALTNPVGAVTAKMRADIAKAVAERSSRDGSFRRLNELFNERLVRRGEIAKKSGNAPKTEKAPKPSVGKPEPEAPAGLDSIVSEVKSAGVDMDKYLANVSEKAANKMADHAYKYAVESAVSGKNTLDFDRISGINDMLVSGKEGKAATVGDVIRDPYLRKLYSDALDTPIEVSNAPGTAGSVGEFVIDGPKKGTIVFRSGNTETGYNLADTILHEAAHAIRSKKGRAMVNDYAVPAPQTAPAPKIGTPKKSKSKGVPKPTE